MTQPHARYRTEMQACFSLAVALVVSSGLAPSRAEGPNLVSGAAENRVALQGQNRFEIRGIRGRIILRSTQPGELQYMTTELGDRKKARPIDLWHDRGTLRLMPPAGVEETPRLLEIAVSSELPVYLTVSDCELSVSALLSNLDIEGQRLRLELRGVQNDSTTLDIDEGTIDVSGVGRSFSLDGSKLEGRIRSIQGPAEIHLAGGRLEISDLAEGLRLSFEGADLSVDKVRGAAILEGVGGSLALGHAAAGGEIRLSSANLLLGNSQGPFTVETDSDVQCMQVPGLVRIRARDGRLTGAFCGEQLELELEGGQATLQDVRGRTAIRGERTRVELSGLSGPATLRLKDSSIMVRQADAAVDIENDYGEIEIQGAAKDVKIKNLEGEVRVDGQAGTLELRSTGGSAEVNWAAAPPKDSLVESAGQDVTMSFPAGVACHVAAETTEGAITSEFPEIVVSPDQRSASGKLGGGNRPTVQVRARGDIQFHTGLAPEVEAEQQP